MALPMGVRKFFGHALDFAQHGEQHNAAKVLKGFGGGGVLEIVANDQGSLYRAVYTVKFREVVLKIIRERLKIAEKLSQEMHDE